MERSVIEITDNQTWSSEEREIHIPVVDNTESRKRIVARIETITLSMVQQICSGHPPQLEHLWSETDTTMDTRTTDENDFGTQTTTDDDEETEQRTATNFSGRRSKEKLALTMTVMAAVHRLLVTNSTMTRRSLYYDLKNSQTSNLVAEQRILDQTVNHVANLLDCAPWELNLLPTSKGLVAGELTLTLADNRIVDCSTPGGALIPHIASNVISARARARMVLIVEKDAVFQKLLEDDCPSSLNCILVTGKGYPDVATRMLVKLLAERLELPVYIIVDADPYGVDIMCVYRFGSATLSKERQSLACPSARWLGVHPSELLALGVDRVPLTKSDFSKLLALEGRPYASDALLKELEIMRTGKAEIESVASSSRRFLAATYLPCKIKGDDYI